MHTFPAALLVGALMLLGAPPSTAAERATPVSVVKATRAPVYDEVPLTGSVESRRVSRLSPKLAGFVERVLVEEGNEVAEGQPLLRLDPVMAEIELTRIEAQVREAGARLAEAERQRDEAVRLLDDKHIPSTEYEARESEVAIAAAVLQRLKAELARQREVLERHVIRAPYDGIIGEKLVESGQWVETGTAVFELVEIKVLRIDVPVPQYYFGRVDVGTPVTVRFDAIPEYSLSGAVTMKIPVSSESGRTFPVRIDFDNEDARVAPGMSARVRVQLARANEGESLLVPRDAVVRKPDGSKTVWRIDQQDGIQVAHPVPVETGRPFHDNIEILEGAIRGGDRVVIRGNELLEPGQRVEIHREVDLEI